MALATNPIVFGLYDCKVAAMTTTTSTPEVYNSLIDLPGVTKLTCKLNFDALSEVRGDNTVLATLGGDVNSVEFSAENVVLSVEALDELMAGVASSSGTSTKAFTVKTSEAAQYFKLVGKAKLDGGGSMIVTLYKCRAGDLSLELSDNRASVPKFGGRAIQNNSNEIIRFQVYDSDETIS